MSKSEASTWRSSSVTSGAKADQMNTFGTMLNDTFCRVANNIKKQKEIISAFYVGLYKLKLDDGCKRNSNYSYCFGKTFISLGFS